MLISNYGLDCEKPKKLDIVISATGNHQCLVFSDVIEFASWPIENEFFKWNDKGFRHNLKLFISPEKLNRWAKFFYKTAGLNDSVFVFDVNGTSWNINGNVVSDNLQASLEGNGCVLELIFDEKNMKRWN